ncbi:hypothetical protein ACFL6S_23945 [Candidatus Poribacteria bacterium]
MSLQFGPAIKLREFVKLLREKIPVLDDDVIGGPQFREKYERGPVMLSILWK